MKHVWDMYLNLLPVRLRDPIDRLKNKLVFETRLRLNQPVEVVTEKGSVWLDVIATAEDLAFTVNVASKYSPWAADSVRHGYITARGGHRIGFCGQAALLDGNISTIRTVTSLSIRAAHDFTGIAPKIPQRAGSILIVGCPGSGKTTLLRDMIRSIAACHNVSVVDEREELFPVTADGFCFPSGGKTDVLSGCPKAAGIDMVLRTMTPDYIAVDEITLDNDCKALVKAGWCGVKLLATAHAGSMEELKKRPVYKPLICLGLFDTFVMMRPDKSWYIVRETVCC